MNTVIFITKENSSDMEETAAMIAKRHHEVVNGACMVSFTPDAFNSAKRVIALLSPIFKTTKWLRIPASYNNHHRELSTMFACFLVNGYSMFPGPWLILDSWAEPLVDEAISLSGRQHRAFGGGMVGRCVEKPNGMKMPVGPMTMDVEKGSLKMMTFAHLNSWRERITPVATKIGFRTIPDNEWMWSLSRGQSRQVEIIHKPLPAMPTEEEINAMSDEDLQLFIFRASGKAPSARSKRPHLLRLALEATQLVPAQQ